MHCSDACSVYSGGSRVSTFVVASALIVLAGAIALGALMNWLSGVDNSSAYSTQFILGGIFSLLLALSEHM